MIYREAIRNGWTERNAARLMQAKEEPSGRIRFLSEEEEKRYLNSANLPATLRGFCCRQL